MHRQRVCILVAGTIGSDVRVLKQLRALSATARYDAHAIGLSGPRGDGPVELPGVTVESIPADPPLRGLSRPLDAARRLACALPSGRWATHAFFAHGAARRAMLERARASGAALFHANDWNTLPIACVAARATGARVVFDAHEMGILEHSGVRFRLFHRSLIEGVERRYLPSVDGVVAVCGSIADELVRHYGLDPAKAHVIRNAAETVPVVRRPLDASNVRVLYHGGAFAGRGLEDMIDSVALWRPHLSLSLRVVGRAPYLESLRARIEQRGLGARIRMLEPVATTELVPRAAEFDVGIHAIIGSEAWNNRICLPNKLFEYAMAGLAVYVTDLPEMRALVTGHGLGGLFAERDPASIAAALNAATEESLARAQEAALRFSRAVNAEVEFAKLVALYDELLGRP